MSRETISKPDPHCVVPLLGVAACILFLSALSPHGRAPESFEHAQAASLQVQAIDSTDLAPFVEPDFPFITSTLDAGSRSAIAPDRNVAERGLILRLGEGVYACFDPDLLRMSVAWTGEFMSMGTMAQVSYDRPTYKVNAIPKVLGTPTVATGMYAGWTSEPLAFADPRPSLKSLVFCIPLRISIVTPLTNCVTTGF